MEELSEDRLLEALIEYEKENPVCDDDEEIVDTYVGEEAIVVQREAELDDDFILATCCGVGTKS